MCENGTYKLKKNVLAELRSKKVISSLLKSSVVKVTFTKNDGSERSMLCTLIPEFLPLVEESDVPKHKIKLNEDVQRVYDLEAKAWRSFRFESIIDLEFGITMNNKFGVFNEQ